MKKRGIPHRLFFILAFIAGILISILPLSAQVYEDELRNLDPVEFVNFEGPHFRIDTRAQIRDIGYSLGLAIREGASQAGELRRYFVIQSITDPDGFRLNADIFGIGSDAAVDHIQNLRLIIQGYLEASHQYNERDAALLAEYITIYNAVHRGNWSFFTERYNTPVLGHLTQERVGLAIRYDDWPGRALIVIPLGTRLGGALSAVDTSAISDFRVMEQLRQEPDMGLVLRRDMVDLMEREADEAASLAALSRDAIRNEEQILVQEQQQLRQEQQLLAQERQQPDANLLVLDQREQVVEIQQAALQQRIESLEEQRQQADRQEAFALQRIIDTQLERQQIAQDHQALLNREPPPMMASGVLGLSIVNPDSSLGRFVLLDDSGSIIRQSALNTVNTRTVSIINNRVFAVAGENRGSGAIRLIEVDGTTLEMLRQGNNDIAPGSLLWVNGNDIYALISQDGNHNLARFNTDLALQSRSSFAVHPNATVFFADGFLMTQRSDGSAVMLNPGDLSERR